MYREIFKIGELAKRYSLQTNGKKQICYDTLLFDKEYISYQHAVDDLDSLPVGIYQIYKLFVKE